MGITDKAKKKLEDAAGGVRGAQTGAGDDEESRQPNEARFEPEEGRRASKPKDHLPLPRDPEA